MKVLEHKQSRGQNSDTEGKRKKQEYVSLLLIVERSDRDETEKNCCQRKGINSDQSFQGLLCQKMYIS